MEDFKTIVETLNSSGVVGLFVLIGLLLWKGGILTIWEKRINTDKEFIDLAKKFTAKTDELKDSVDYCKRTREILEKLEIEHAATLDNPNPGT